MSAEAEHISYTVCQQMALLKAYSVTINLHIIHSFIVHSHIVAVKFKVLVNPQNKKK